MAITVTTFIDSPHLFAADVTATADADQNAMIPHNFGVVPTLIWFLPLRTAYHLSQWRMVVPATATDIEIRKVTSAGGSPNPQVRVYAMLPQMSPLLAIP